MQEQQLYRIMTTYHDETKGISVDSYTKDQADQKIRDFYNPEYKQQSINGGYKCEAIPAAK